METTDIFAGDDPFALATRWLREAEETEPRDANAVQLATVDGAGMPNVRTVLVKDIESDGRGYGAFVFYTNYGSAKARELDGSGRGALVFHWKSLGRQVRARGSVEREDGSKADDYYRSRAYGSRIGAWASRQSEPVSSREAIMAAVETAERQHGANPDRPPFWGGFRLLPVEMEFWSDGAHRLHDRFRWRRQGPGSEWTVERLYP